MKYSANKDIRLKYYKYVSINEITEVYHLIVFVVNRIR